MTVPVPEQRGGEWIRSDIEKLRDDLITEIRQMRQEVAGSYMRKDVYESDQHATDRQIHGLENEIHAITGRINRTEERGEQNRRLVVGALLFPLILLILGWVLYGGAFPAH